ncbi:Soluble pyridine nucleotide transhydrogenase [hydrothermal vent metagenome]|uniref:NAD(P)(+) transhydrogenase (Si-specific) n=1 Tax=hydrothermal vent metagenome TaxID=652676 RepID=A0A3B0X8D8_9ZZZZ
MSENYDLIVIGSGPAGQKAALQAAKINKRVVVIERGREIGGVAVHTGTIPSKTLRESAMYLSGYNQRGVQGKSPGLKDKLSMEDLLNRVAITVNQETDVVSHQLRRNNVEIIQGTASFLDPHRIQIENRQGKISEIQGDYILLATGTKPHHPEHIPFDGETVIDSDDVLHLKKLPRSMAIIGAGVIGVEYASIFSMLNIKITLVDSSDKIMSFMDRQIIDEMTHLMRDCGTVVRLSEEVCGVEKNADNQITVSLKSGKKFCVDLLMFTSGRMGCVNSLNLGAAGLSADASACVQVNAFYQTAVPHIYAAGDLAGFPGLASTSMEQGRLSVRHAFGLPLHSRPELFPYGVYAVPEMSMVGKTEEQLTEEKIPYEVGVARLNETTRGHIMGLQEGMLKLIFCREDKKLLGVHVLGGEATELVHIGQAVLALGGGLDFFIENVFNYPTLAEAYKIAALDACNRMTGQVDQFIRQ